VKFHGIHFPSWLIVVALAVLAGAARGKSAGSPGKILAVQI